MADNRTVFKKIIDGDVPAKLIYEDEHCLAFRDIDPRAPTHILVIPRKEIRSLAEVEEQDAALLGHLMVAISKIAREQGLANGFRVVTNSGKWGGQSVDHLHFHLLGGRQLSWPPG
ncbi:MAG: histidine triad nucleotide-binding protein [Planctomycetota bacterium]|jgi:histidine triad (HIT) family protein